MRFLLYLLSFVLLDAIVPAGCRSERPYYYVEEHECVIDSTVVGMSLSSSPNDSLLHKWNIAVSPTSAELTYLTCDDSVLFSKSRTLDVQTYEDLVRGVNECNLYIADYYYRDVYVNPRDQVTDFTYQQPDTAYSGFMTIDDSGARWATLFGNVDSLRMLFISLFPKYFDENEKFVKK